MTKVGVGQGVGGGRPIKYDEAFCEALADRLLEFADDEDSISLMGFSAKNGFTYKDWARFGERSEKFCLAYKKAKATIGYRRELGAATGKYTPKMLGLNAWQYDPEVRERENELKMKEKENGLIPAQLAAQAQIDCLNKEVARLKELLGDRTS